MKRFWRDNSLSLVLFGCFVVFLVGLSLSGHAHENEELASHGQAAVSYLEYIRSGGFIEAVFENWESEFLQMGALVLLTIWLRQKGAPDSKKLKKEPVDTSSRSSIIHSSGWGDRLKAAKHILYANSLTLALGFLFLLSFALHAMSGTAAYNEEAALHNETTLSVWQYIVTARFWFESFQNWQSEFLAVGALIVLSIYLRQRGSPESKPVGAPHSQTGEA
jgi:hypothetical protein